MAMTMLSRMIRLLTLLAVAMLPLGMARASAPVQPAGHHAMAGMGSMTPGNCDEMDRAAGPHDGHKLPGECAMACASALPALPDSPPLIARISFVPAAPVALPAARLHGLILDIATPPPRIA
jgi:hypothetical protein